MKKITVIFILCIFFCGSTAFSKPAMRNTQRLDSVMTEGAMVPEKPAESVNSYIAKGDKILNYYAGLANKTGQEKYLIAAKYFYYQANRIDISNQNAFVGRARVDLFQNKIRDAKNNLFMALNFDENNPKVNYYLGESFFQDGDFDDAIKYYTNAYMHGYRRDYRTNLKLGICYEKLDDTKRARYYYTNAMASAPSQAEARHRLQGLDIIEPSSKTSESPKPLIPKAQELPLDPDDLKGLPLD